MRLLIFTLLLIPSWVSAQPAPVFARTFAVPASIQPRLDLEQDRCYVWGEPGISLDGNAVQVTQTVTPVPTCTNTGVALALIQLPQLPVGSYRLTYVPNPVGFGPMPVSVVDFNVRADMTLVSDPVDPVALEPINMNFSIRATCERVAGVRFVGSAIRIELDFEQPSPFPCDEIGEATVTIGAFPPGTHRVEVAYLPEDGGQVLKSTDIVVRAGVPEPLKPPGYRETVAQDYSGAWIGLNEEPSTGMTFVHTSVPPPADGESANTIIGIWYRYAADGTPVWYWVEVRETNGHSRFAGSVYAYSATNPAAPGWQRTVAATPIGSISIRFGPVDNPARVVATIASETTEFTLHRLRWLRSAWAGTL